VVSISALAGLQIIRFFGISIASFQVGGGMLLLISSLHMLNAEPPESGEQEVVEGQNRADAGVSVAVVPLAIPLLTGPATISTVVIYAEKTKTLLEHAVLVGYGVVIGLATWAAFSASGRIAKVLGRTGINVMTRLMGLILAAMAVELLADGLIKLFPILASPTLHR
jgi:multiple antibiotic resistance protein